MAKQKQEPELRHEHPRSIFQKFSNLVTHWTGTSAAFFSAISIVIIWAVTGPIFHYSDTWQLVINTGTTIITFLMVFVIQQSQNFVWHRRLMDLKAYQSDSARSYRHRPRYLAGNVYQAHQAAVTVQARMCS